MKPYFYTRSSRIVALVFILTATTGTAWYYWRGLLASIAHVLVREDPLLPVDLIIMSHASTKATALEAVHLYRDGLGTRIALPAWASDPIDDEIRRLGVLCLDPTVLARTILEHSGVAPEDIVVLPNAVDGTETEIRTVVAFVQQRRFESMRFITARSHTGRARWLLRHSLPPDIRISVGSSRFDAFSIESWWQRRDQSREVISEYLRWFNTVFLGDPWSRWHRQ